MSARIKKSGKHQYLQIVENRKGSPSIRLRFGPHMREMVAGMILLKKDENIRGHVFLSFLALVLRKELESPLERYGYCFEWADIKQDLKALQYPLPFESYNLCQRANGSAKNFFGYVMCLISLNYFFATVQDQ